MFFRNIFLNKPMAGLALCLAAAPALWAADLPGAGRVRISDLRPVVTASQVAPAPEVYAPPATPAFTPIPESAPVPQDSTASYSGSQSPGPGYHSQGDPIQGYNYSEITRRNGTTRPGRWCDSCLSKVWTGCSSRWNKSGCGRGRLGIGRRWDFGSRYEIVAVNPGQGDPRDSQFYAAQGYGIPLSVPVAPVAGDQYNYGWGLPSSRLTPISTPSSY